MMNKKIKVAFIYKPSYKFVNGTYFDKTLHHFFMEALKRNTRLEITYFPCQNDFDVSKIKTHDIILLSSDGSEAVPNLIGIKECTLPVICRTADSHTAKELGRFQYHEKWKIDCYFSTLHKDHFYEYYPKNYNYRRVFYTVEPSEYANPIPFEHRFKDKILLTGSVGRPTLLAKLVNKVHKPFYSAWYHYRLRSECRSLPYVIYNHAIDNDFKLLGDSYAKTLFRFRTSIAATTRTITGKYMEIPAAGCLTFMETNEANKADSLGLEDMVHAVYINEKNYKKKFKEYLSDVDNPKWKKIADNGRKFILENRTNDNAVDSLADIMEEYLK